MDDAMDSSDLKTSLIGLIADVESRRGPADRIRSCLEAGGEACAEMIADVLDHAMEVLEGGLSCADMDNPALSDVPWFVWQEMRCP